MCSLAFTHVRVDHPQPQPNQLYPISTYSSQPIFTFWVYPQKLKLSSHNTHPPSYYFLIRQDTERAILSSPKKKQKFTPRTTTSIVVGSEKTLQSILFPAQSLTNNRLLQPSHTENFCRDLRLLCMIFAMGVGVGGLLSTYTHGTRKAKNRAYSAVEK